MSSTSRSIGACAVFLLLGAGCQSPTDVIAIPPNEGAFDAPVAPDLDPAPDVVEVVLEARLASVEIAPGRSIEMWTYEGGVPGPTIEARAGDLVRVRFTNSLPEATTIHWHGLRIPAAMDGVPIAQAPIPPGETFTYEFVVPDAGTFWYHPHVRSDEQVERGLYGAFVVRGAGEPEVTSERIVVLDDLLVDEQTFDLAPFDEDQAMPGRQGNLLLVNGRAHPIAGVRAGGLHRFRFVNAANARYFRLSAPGHRLIQIGTDGGLLEAPLEHDDLLLVPGERADVLVVAGEPSSSIAWQTLAYDRGHGTGQFGAATLFTMRTSSEDAVAPPAVPGSFAVIEALPPSTITRELRLQEMEGAHAAHGGAPVMFAINDRVYPDVESIVARLGDVEVWSIVNTTEMDHPFHLHGFRFQIVDTDGAPATERAWRDTINIAAGQTVRFAVSLDANPGTWMFHCHILEHAERGMMGELSVEP